VRRGVAVNVDRPGGSALQPPLRPGWGGGGSRTAGGLGAGPLSG
jgi:hypothetical protein